MTDLKAKMAKHQSLKRTRWEGSTKIEYWAATSTYNGLLSIAKQQAALIETLLKPLQACDEAMYYMSEYDIPICLPDDVKQALQAAKEAGYGG